MFRDLMDRGGGWRWGEVPVWPVPSVLKGIKEGFPSLLLLLSRL